MGNVSGHWLLVADQKITRLLRGTFTPQGRFHLELCSQLEEQWDPVQHGRPSARTGKDGHSYASSKNEDHERLHRYAKLLSDWIGGELKEHGIEKVEFFATARLLGELRKVMPKALHDRLVEHEADLTQVPLGELATHRTIQGILEGHAPSSEPG